MTRKIGVVVLIIGVLLLIASMTNFTTKEKVIDAGPVEVTRDKTSRAPLTPWVGVAVIAAGGVILISGRNK